MRVGFVIVLLGLIGCTRGGSGYYGTTEPKHGPDEIWTVLGSEPEYIDPGKCSDAPGGSVILNMFAGLVQPHPATLEPMPDLAERWEASEDGKRYTFHLRPAFWSDGTPLTAADFVYSWRRVLDPATGSKYQSFLYPVRYAEMFANRALIVRGAGATSEAELRAAAERFGPVDSIRLAPELDAAFVLVGGDDEQRASMRAQMMQGLAGAQLGAKRMTVAVTDASIVGVRAESEQTLIVELENPVPYFLNLLCFYTTMPVPRHVLEQLEKEGKNPDLWTRPEHIVTSGAYILSEWQFRQRMRLQKNERYWDAAHVRTPKIRVTISDSYNTVLNLYEAGEVDSIGSSANLPAEFVDTLSGYKDFVHAPQNGTFMFWINTKVPPLDDVRVRRALSLGIDREALVKHVTRAKQLPSADLVPDGLGGYQGLHSPLFDPPRARELLAEAGYGPERPLPTVTLTYNTTEGNKQIAEAVQAMWQKHVGVKVEIENQEWKVYLKNLRSHDFQIGRLAWIGDYPDPYTYLDLLLKGSGNNHSQWSDPRYEDVMRRANQQTDKAARLALLREAEQVAMDAVPVIPVYTYTRSELIKPYVRGHVINYEYWWIDRRWYDGVPGSQLDDGLPPRPASAHGSGGAN
jgi:oligopeptide transport system substrate-binding protein